MKSIFFSPAVYLPLKLMNVKGAIHVGAHEAEELDNFVSCGIKKIIWIEALPEKQKILKSKLSNYSEMYLGNFAAGEKNCTLDFNIASNGMSSSLLKFDAHTAEHPDIKMLSSVKVNMQKIDDFIDQINVNRKTFNFLLLDIQGYELNALKGMINQLSFVDYIWTEVSTKDLYVGGVKLKKMDEFLGSYGFTRVVKVMSKHGWGDALYVRKLKTRLRIYCNLIKILKALKNIMK